MSEVDIPFQTAAAAAAAAARRQMDAEQCFHLAGGLPSQLLDVMVATTARGGEQRGTVLHFGSVA